MLFKRRWFKYFDFFSARLYFTIETDRATSVLIFEKRPSSVSRNESYQPCSGMWPFSSFKARQRASRSIFLLLYASPIVMILRRYGLCCLGMIDPEESISLRLPVKS